MSRKKSKGKKKSELALEVVKHSELLFYGTVLAIDPSSGSNSSLPGYSLWNAGKLVEYGTVALPPGTRPLSQRLFLLQKVLKESFDSADKDTNGVLRVSRIPDLLVIEKIASGFGFGGAGLSATRGQASLLKSVGVIMSVWDVPCLEVSPQTWHARVDWKKYKKSDAQDAVTLYCAARQVCEEEMGLQTTEMIYV